MEEAKKMFEQAAELFTALIRDVEHTTGQRANFKWTYDKEGRKCLGVDDVAPASKPTDEAVAKARTEVPDMMAKAEELVGKPVEIALNETGPARG
jgi:hypothetical protein